MLLSPRVGEMVRVWYRRSLRGLMLYHGRVGRVLVSGRGKPRNHLVRIGGEGVVVPCGNLIKIRREGEEREEGRYENIRGRMSDEGGGEDI